MSQQEEARTSALVALLDTSVQVDRVKMNSRRQEIALILDRFDFVVTTGIALLEFKATVIQECVTIYNALRRDGRFTTVRDALIESQHPQHKLRAHVFNNLLCAFAASSFEVTETEDRRLAEKARLLLEDQIPRLYDWFRSSVDAVLDHKIGCTRALECPEKKKAAFGANLPICRRGKNKSCRVEALIRERANALCQSLKALPERSEQLDRALSLFERVNTDAEADLSHSDCRNAGDCLIALEAQETATHALSTNAREWQVLSELLGFQFVPVTYAKP